MPCWIRGCAIMARERGRPGFATLRRLLHHRLFVLGCVLFGIVLLVAVLAPVIAPVDPNKLAMRRQVPASGTRFRVWHGQFRALAMVAGGVGRAAFDEYRRRGGGDQCCGSER